MITSTATMQQQDGTVIFPAVRKLPHSNLTQARKAASRIWGNDADRRRCTLLSVFLVAHGSPGFTIHERGSHAWRSYPAGDLSASPHIAACIDKLGVDDRAPVPEILVINGWEYRRTDYVGNL